MTGIDAGSSLVMRTAPRYGATPVARFGNGLWLELEPNQPIQSNQRREPT